MVDSHLIIGNVTDGDGMYHDMTIFNIGDTPEAMKKLDPTADVKRFFTDPFSLEGHGKKKRCHCKICQYVPSNILLRFCISLNLESGIWALQLALEMTAHR